MRLTPESQIDLGPVFLIEVDDLPENDDLESPEPQASFVANVRDFGVLSPIWVERLAEAYRDDGGPTWLVRSGNRRIKAVRANIKATGTTTIPAQEILNGGAAVGEALAIIANAQRQDNALSDLRAIVRLLDRSKDRGEQLTFGDIQKATGLSIPTIEKRLKLRQVPEEILSGVAAGTVAITVAERVAKLPESTRRELVAVLDAEGKLTAKMVYEASRARKEEALATIDMSFLNDEDAEPVYRSVDEEIGIVGREMHLAIKNALVRVGCALLGGETLIGMVGDATVIQTIRTPSGRDVRMSWSLTAQDEEPQFDRVEEEPVKPKRSRRKKTATEG